MKSNELRIGNYVYFKHCDYDVNIPRKINYTKNPNEVGLDGVFQNRIEYNQLEGIKLTKDILVKFGFETTAWDNHETYRKMIGNNDFTVVISSSGICEIGDILIREMNYVHELQNLLYYLIGYELECVGF